MDNEAEEEHIDRENLQMEGEVKPPWWATGIRRKLLQSLLTCYQLVFLSPPTDTCFN